MNPRTTIVLVALNVIVYAAILFTADSSRGPERTKLLAQDLDLGNASTIRFSAAKGLPAFTLARADDGRWRLDGPNGPLANQSAVKRILEDLGRAPVLPFETGVESELGLEPPARTVAFGAGDTDLLVVELGRVHPLGLGVFVRIRGEDEAHLTFPDLAPLLTQQPGNFRELRIFPFSPLDITRLELRRDTPQGTESIEAERKWLTWFLKKPRRLRGSRRFDSVVASLLGIRRQGVVQVPRVGPNLRVTVHTATDSVGLDVWVYQGQDRWIGRVRGEESGFPLSGPELEPRLLLEFRHLWDHRLFHDPARTVTRLEWSVSGHPPTVIQRDPANPDAWYLLKPRKAAGDREACNQFVQELVRLEADGLDPPGTTPGAVGLDPPDGHLVVQYATVGGPRSLVIGKPRGKSVRVFWEREPENIFVLNAAKLSLIPSNALTLVDRTIYRGDWRFVALLEIRRGSDERFRLENVGAVANKQWQRIDVSPEPRFPEAFVPGAEMLRLINYLTEKLRGEAVLAWSTDRAPAEWGVDRPRYVISFPDTNAKQGNRRVKIAIGRVQEDRAGRRWYPCWHLGEALSERTYVYRIDDALVRRIRKVLP
jgi:hypothetical protein